MTELIYKHKETQELIDRTLLKIGYLYSFQNTTENEKIISEINDKVDLVQKLTIQLEAIEEEIRKNNNAT